MYIANKEAAIYGSILNVL